MQTKGYLKALKAAFFGLLYTAGWLLVDLFTGEPWGDFVLFGLMAVVNVAFGWKFVMLSAKKESSNVTTKNSVPFEPET